MASMDNDKKKELLAQFVSNTEMVEAVKEELLKGVIEQGVFVEGKEFNANENWALALYFNKDENTSNDQLGADLRAAAEGIRFVESAFKKIESYKPKEIKEGSDNKNPAR